MSLSKSVDGSERWAITEKGRYDLIFSPTCQCNPRLHALLIACDQCGTVFGSVQELDRRPERIKGMRRWDR